MAISDATKKTKIFQLLNLPQKDTALSAFNLVTISGPKGENFSLDGVKAQVDAALLAATTTEEAQIDLVIAEFDKIWLKQDTFIRKDQTTEGILADFNKRVEILRDHVSDLLGIYIPKGGFLAEFKRVVRSTARGGGANLVTR